MRPPYSLRSLPGHGRRIAQGSRGGMVEGGADGIESTVLRMQVQAAGGGNELCREAGEGREGKGREG